MALGITEIKKLRVADLRTRLSDLGLPINGLKAELVERLFSYYQQQRSIEEQQQHGSQRGAQHEEFAQVFQPDRMGEPPTLHSPPIQPPRMDFGQANEPPSFPQQPPPSQQTMQMPPVAHMQAPQMHSPQMQPPQMQQPSMHSPQMQHSPMQRPPMHSPQMQHPSMQPPPMHPSQMQRPPMHSPQMQLPPMQPPPMQSRQMEPPQMQPPQMQSLQMEPPQLQSLPMDPPQMQARQMQPPQMQVTPMELSQRQPPQLKPPQMQPHQMEPLHLQSQRMEPSQMQSRQMEPPQMEPPRMQSHPVEPSQLQSRQMEPSPMQSSQMEPPPMLMSQLQARLMQPEIQQPPTRPPPIQSSQMQPPQMQPSSMQLPSFQQPPAPFQTSESPPVVQNQPSFPTPPPQPPKPPHMLLQASQTPMQQPPPMPIPSPPTPPAQLPSPLDTPNLPMQLPNLGAGQPPPIPPPPPPPMSLAQMSAAPPPVVPAETISPPPQHMSGAEMMEIRQVQEREKHEREAAEVAEVARIAEEQQELIEREKQRILQQQQERIRQRQEQQRHEDEQKMQKAMQQQKMLEEQRQARELDEETRQKVVQQQILIEHQRVVEETMKEADLLRDQQRALAVQREEEVKIRKQQEMLEIEASQQREHQQQVNMGGLLPIPTTGAPTQSRMRPEMERPPRPSSRLEPPPMGQNIRGPRPGFQPGAMEHRGGPHDRHRMPQRDGRGPGPDGRGPGPDGRGPGPESRHMMGRDRFERMPPHLMMDKGHPPPLLDDGGPPKMDDELAKDIKVPQAMEKVFAFKNKRAQQIGANVDEAAEKAEFFPPEGEREASDDEADNEEEEEEEEEEGQEEEGKKKSQSNNQKMSKNRRRKLKKKKRKAAKRAEQEQAAEENQLKKEEEEKKGKKKEEKVEVEYVAEKIEVIDPAFRQFQRIFQAFQLSEPLKPEVREPEEATKLPEKQKEKDSDSDSDDDSDMEEDDGKPRISKKKLRKLNRLSVAELKQLVTRPDVVEMHDVTARDPKLLVYLKAYRNTVGVPRHWCFKRKYLQGKRGIIKPPFELPEFIQRTGIMEMRQALQEKEEQQTMKTKMRQKVRPKMGKIDIDYQKLHDAFFRWQTKPKLTIHGDLYYEGKEFETKLKEKKPGELSEELRTALGMPTGGNANNYPPPWLIAMQRYGPPPSYPHLKIQGLNAPIPESCSFGYHAGGWGKPPVDQTGKPLYGNVFGTDAADLKAEEEEEIDTTRWGELESESEESSSEEESEEEREGGEIDESGLITPADGGLITPSGLTSIPTGMETPDMIELRKKKIEDAMEQGTETPQLYTVIPEKKTNVGAAMVGSTHVYDLPPVGAKKLAGATASEGVAIALDPSELDMDTEAMTAKYEEQVREQQSQLEKEDFSDMVAEHAAKQKNKRKKQTQDSGRAAKKYKEFKF
ncbi:splicing factor 3B subunit 2 isoform X1 [Strongylocentrotus purpuratus]|uniref:SAP domain-containing protein n=1 Tax=Strongylocentrotus purpuratus TaxID=7668 RepID=A0A7M7PQV5_STRPU|nr:splicing factor 3B subunit 2 isoform X1 [Strongylocentrotus purpuratus]